MPLMIGMGVRPVAPRLFAAAAVVGLSALDGRFEGLGQKQPKRILDGGLTVRYRQNTAAQLWGRG